MPRLQRFYGGDPDRWLTGIPVVLLRAYGRMLPRLEAEESLLAVSRGSVRIKDARGLVRGWTHTAHAGQRPAAAIPASIPGITIVKVRKAEA